MGLTIYNEATPSVGDNFLSGTADYMSNRWRAISKIAFYGFTAIADSELEIFFGNKKVGNLHNLELGDVFDPTLMWPFGS